MKPPYITRAGILGTAVVLAVAAGCIRLGIWQLDRLEQRRTHNAAVADRIGAAPIRIGDARADTAGMLYRTATLAGVYDLDRSLVLAGRSFRGASGVHLFTPLRLDDGSGAVLINRGWLPAIDPGDVDLAPLARAGTTRVRGLVLPFPRARTAAPAGDDDADAVTTRTAPADSGAARLARVRFRLDVDRLRADLPYPLLPAYVRLLPDADPPAYNAADGGTNRPRRLPPPSLDDGPHLGYALQWFSFAAIAIIGWTILALRRGELGRRPR